MMQNEFPYHRALMRKSQSEIENWNAEKCWKNTKSHLGTDAK